MVRQEQNTTGGGRPDGMPVGLPSQYAPVSPSNEQASLENTEIDTAEPPITL